MRTFESLLNEGAVILEDAGIKEARLDAWLLLEYKTGKSRAYYFAHRDERMPEELTAEYLSLCMQRAGHIPLQHLTHQAFFMGYEFYVNEHVLIPRQDTETLAEEALRLLRKVKDPNILDMCTGSGCILLSLLAELPGCKGTGADISADALSVASENAKRLGVSDRALLVESDTFSGDYFQEKSGKHPPQYDMLISNPPYIPTAEIGGLMEEVRLHDPLMALDGHEDGLFFYRTITNQGKEYIRPRGWLLYEIGSSQGEAVAGILKTEGFERIAVIKDLAGHDRVVAGQKP
ncbi:MAG: peptide chain release factor N(5)-glutamine methyltransferase [Eubacteriales bacterium]|nr:peptide chain release factor N(5)-glutamine methyltransferase [Eubacteriales bacterium]